MHCVVGCVTVTLGGVLRNDGHNYLENDGQCSLWYVVYLPILCSVQDISCIKANLPVSSVLSRGLVYMTGSLSKRIFFF